MKTKLLIISFVLILTLCGCTKPHARSDMSGSTALSGEKAVPAGEKAQSVSSVTTMPPSAQTPVPRSTPRPTAAPSSNLNNVKYTTYTDSTYNFKVDIPTFLFKETSSEEGSSFVSADGKTKLVVYGSDVPSYYDNLDMEMIYDSIVSEIQRETNYDRIGDDWLVISWDDNDTVYYMKYYLITSYEDNVLIMSYPKLQEKAYDDIVTHISQSFIQGLPSDVDFNENDI